MTTISPKRLARTAGLLYLVIFVMAPFAFLLAKESLIVAGDATATAANIVESESMFRLGMTAEAAIFLVEIVLTAVLYVLFRPVSRPVSLAAAFARLGEAVVQGVNLLTSVLVLTVVGGAGYLTVVGADQLDAWALLFLEANEFMVLVWGLFFGLHLLLLGWLVYRSGFLPRVIGALLGLASLGYLAEGFGTILSPGSADVLATIVIVVALPGELALTFWLLAKGVDERAWRARAALGESVRPPGEPSSRAMAAATSGSASSVGS